MSLSRRHYPAHPALAVSIAVFREGRVLLASRAEAPYRRMFTLPGGLVETGETVEFAALRELREETGVLARLAGFNQVFQHISRDGTGRVERHYVILSFVALWIGGEAAPSREAIEVLWRAPGDYEGLSLTPGLTHIVADAKRIVEGAR
ncbi:NUDIX hydrolase [Rhodoblastus acidophilus]|uniref:NUDIX hydrolase n=1 Tax=Candidatus Rhodoblastus alkanivorans TaxID=2954117 RepID=A0ABS9ZA83_9HYPH|nr:NUDIX hydrolase [Candidatus Rhodoblastus alkanivorans]MCI4684107.1 NUDIX hydrolase [Candidatus Rhodoblastus alkanivorans]MDI4641427.1 NUDIX hydrolase [Rhodoblastus acidophilus]